MPLNRKQLWTIAKSLLAIGIIVLVARQFVLVLQRDDLQKHPLTLRWEWLIPAGLLYLGAHTFWGTFWVRLLRNQGLPIGFGVGLRAYFVSQFGKYIPGKVAVIVMRTEMLKAFGCSRVPVAVTAVYETLTSMGAGAMLGVACIPFLGVLPEEVSKNVAWFGLVALIPLSIPILHKIGRRAVMKMSGRDKSLMRDPSHWLMAQGLMHGACGWCLLSLSLACTLQAIAPTPPAWNRDAFLGDLAAVALSYVAGFVVLVAPGGIGARELVMQKAVSWRFAEALGAVQADGLGVVIALVLRLAWTAAEVLLAGALYFCKPKPKVLTPSP